MLHTRLVKTILNQYPLDVSGIHGPAHWGRVLENGNYLASITGADLEIVQLFAVLHDCRRTNEGPDFEHGPEAAYFAETLRGNLINLNDERFALLYEACEFHTDGETEADITIQTCWDADRLDLGRAHIVPDPGMLCTEAAQDRKVIEWAHKRAVEGFIVEALDEWMEELL